MSSDRVNSDPYELIDFGDGRKLESLAGYLIDRPSPAAQGIPPVQPERWRGADARYDGERKQWRFRTVWPESLDIDCGGFRMPVQPTPFGHIGLFPEQSENWSWLIERGRALAGGAVLGSDEPPWGLNLFGYTGTSRMRLVSTALALAQHSELSVWMYKDTSDSAAPTDNAIP